MQQQNQHTSTPQTNWQASVYKRPKPVFTIGNCEVWGGSERFASTVPGLSLFVHLTDLSFTHGPAILPAVSLNEEARLIGLGELATPQVPTVSIDWPDGAVPFVDRTWWTKLVLEIMQLDRVLFSCTGGTGRTGTALAIVASKMAVVSEPVRWIRSHYEPDAIETATQIEYLRETINYEGTEVGSHEVAFWREDAEAAWKPISKHRKQEPK